MYMLENKMGTDSLLISKGDRINIEETKEESGTKQHILIAKYTFLRSR